MTDTQKLDEVRDLLLDRIIHAARTEGQAGRLVQLAEAYALIKGTVATTNKTLVRTG